LDKHDIGEGEIILVVLRQHLLDVVDQRAMVVLQVSNVRHDLLVKYSHESHMW